MLENPEYEPEFYKTQNELMVSRYSIIFSKLKINWDKYYSWVCKELNYNEYWIWVFLCGLEKYLNEKDFKKNLKYETINRFYRIKGDYYKLQEYMRNI